MFVPIDCEAFMRRESMLDAIKRLPPNDLYRVVFVITNGMQLTLDALVRTEKDYFVIRGREGGTTDEGRAFFLEYEQVSYLKFDRVTGLTELKRMYGEAVTAEEAARDRQLLEDGGVEQAPVAASPTSPPPPVTADPAAIAKQNLLDRIRAARTSSGGTTPRTP